ncbi:hypothetical protein DEO72_LG5g936 [Vigna unguiculata]|uniref:Uncharacterized protein n=1 Tax=Vigna unguiculata TaxID=3917 RepID=A0A4D6LW10_VIGUN|nr:hypothetical protein DEO72_LG5g936 [Vigna unguiculata]
MGAKKWLPIYVSIKRLSKRRPEFLDMTSSSRTSSQTTNTRRMMTTSLPRVHDADSTLDESEVDNANDVDDTNGAGDAVGANGADVGYDANTFNSVWTMIGLKMELVGEQTNVDDE